MAEIIRMPRMSDTMTEGTIVEWHKKIGDEVKSGDLLAEVETDKATMELESYQNGTLLHIGVPKGETVPVDVIIAILGKKGEDVGEILKQEKAATATSKTEQQTETSIIPQVQPTVATTTPQTTVSTPETAPKGDPQRLFISPLARKIAEEHGLDLTKISGSGDEGRIVKRDVEQYLQQAPAATAQTAAPAQTTIIQLPTVASTEKYEDVPISQMRKTIAIRLAESKYSAPHFYLTTEINMDKAVAGREGLNKISPVKISYNDMIIKAAGLALRQHKAINASWLGNVIRYNEHIHIGMAVAVPEGLLVPVIRFADQKTLSHLAAESRQLAEKARNKKLTPQEMEGSTFSISNLGMMDIEEFTAIINPPNSCILAIGRISQQPRVIDGNIAIANVMRVTLSCDHRVVDGMTGAKFLETFKAFLEEPMNMLV
ncbi:MAG: pyruvate dehydrogenase complex dihydrolipoamide acetyltransferase [Chitinophagales bacterium]|nr:pyruvate dehydrogenase complex dihydrolipoamide acetyltransferase [Bacteroidota bacterium]MCB9044404.1 pyruvate dehydrogenase complex dihydrolipoamide acetyltransferase [Chitinophagales bacterium]